ncbi:hypothetical protein GLAREA_01258 [Glarea lozoyensis ATCC 20868]|uniref:EamA domain-containing protein n=1 Tax=Glarea lozoyensis (strain ATCC 20868 / MF5171) TaxID=1116229 RepID=S3CZV8_GLAL2|nr:uncharacterized protein GLAREA_01258 [Glarea lozoyensis ATCC 20868]EPE25346.1 hypothetical protein GLAREA_01258 [Glarea lozoyensis ATCC 20868]
MFCLPRSTIHVLVASTALVSTKYIINDQGYHYPLHLFTLQASLVVSILTLQRLLNTSASYSRLRWVFSPDDLGVEPAAFQKSKTLLIGLISLAAALPLFAQAIMHSFNLSTLVMLLTLVILISFMMAHAGLQPIRKAGMTTILLGFIMLILYDEYRLSVNGLLFAVPASALLALAKLSLSHSSKPVHDIEMDSRRTLSWQAVMLITISASLGITSIWAFTIEDTLLAFAYIRQLNIVAMFLTSGPSVFTTCNFLGSNQYVEVSVCANMLLFGGVISLASSQLLEPSVSTIVQPTAFVAIMIFSAVVFRCEQLSPRPYEKTSQEGYQIVTHQSTSGLENTNSMDFVKTQPGNMRHNSSVTLAFAAGIVLWILFAAHNSLLFRNPVETRSEAILDHTYRPTIDIDIVVSMYKEDVSSVAEMLSHLRSLSALAG